MKKELIRGTPLGDVEVSVGDVPQLGRCFQVEVVGKPASIYRVRGGHVTNIRSDNALDPYGKTARAVRTAVERCLK